MSMAAESLPSQEEELERKSLDALENLLLRERHGKITSAQLEVGLETLFTAVSGMVSEDLVELITRASEEIREHYDQSFWRARYFVNDEGDIIRFKWRIGFTTWFFYVHSKNVEKVRKFGDSMFPEKSVLADMEKVATGLLKRGYKEI